MALGNCEMCGKESVLLQIQLEGSILSTCPACSKHGNVMDFHKEKPKVAYTLAGAKGPELELIPNFSELVKKARERKNLTQSELAQALAEKESIITKLEAGHFTPELKLAKKLEQYLGVSLTEKEDPAILEDHSIDFKTSTVTIGDLLKKKR